MTDRLVPDQVVSERYQILSVIGEGGMGLVYRVKQIYLNKELAFKVIKKAALSDIVVRRFQQEARAASALKHENIIGVNDFGILDDDTPFLVMELISGETLGQRIKRDGRLKLEEALPIFIQICNGLDFAHKHGVVHRDVKPNNIMLVHESSAQKSPVVKIVDFGIAKFAGHEEGEIQALTRTGEIFGSPLYMSPEQCLGSRIDNRSDVYSLGCVFFEALTGLPPFVGENALSTMMKHQGESHLTLSEASLGLKFPRSLEDIVSRMLSKPPEDRYQSLDLVAADLQSLQGGQKISRSKQASSSVTAVDQNGQMISMTKTRLLLLLVVVGVSSVLIAALLFFVLQPHKQSQDVPEKISTVSSTGIATAKPDEHVESTAIDVPVKVNIPDYKPFLDDDFDELLAHPKSDQPYLLHVADCVITAHILERISKAEIISKVELINCTIELAGFAHFAKMKSLVALNLSGSVVNDDCAKYLLACKNLSSLNVSSTQITDAGLRTITRIAFLKRLSASNLKITDAGIESPNSGLVYLELKDDSKISNIALSSIAQLKLEQLELDRTKVGDEGTKLLTRVKSLKQIGLSNTRVSLLGLRLLCKNLPKLSRIDLSSNPNLSHADIERLKHETEINIETHD